MSSNQRKHDLRFERVVAADAPKLRDFWINMSTASQRTYRPYGERSHLLAPWQEAAERYGAGPDLGFVGITPQGKIAALCVVEWIGIGNRLPNFGVGVDDKYQGLGVGAQLMELILEEADRMDMPQIKLIVVNFNRPAQHLYQKFEFRYVGEAHRENDGLSYFDMIRTSPKHRQQSEESIVEKSKEIGKRNWTIHVIPGAHLDVGWVATPAETYAYGDEIIRAAIDAISGDHPQYRFTVEYTSFMDHFLASYPEYLETVRQLVRDEKLELCASVTGLMHQVLDGELMVRQVIYAQQWAEKTLGQRLITTQHADLSGYTLQFPQVLARTGIKYFSYFSRFHPPIPLHWWQAQDSSRVLAANHPNNYIWGLVLRSEQRATRLPEQLAALEASWPVDDLLMGDEYDSLMGDPTVVEKGAELEAMGIAKFRIETISQFFAAVADADLPTYQGEAPYAIYSIHAANPDTYLQARVAENRLVTAEQLSTLRELAGMGRYPFAALRYAWEELFYPQDHNVGGRHGKLNSELRRTKALSSRVNADQVIQEGMLQLITHIAYAQKENSVALVVYNPLSWSRTDVVHTYIEVKGRGKNGLHVTSSDGAPMNCQVLEAASSADHEMVDHARRDWSWLDIKFVAEEAPPMGYRVYYLYLHDDGTAGTVWKQPPTGFIEGRHFRLKIGEDGAVHSLVWKEKDIELAGKGEHEFNEIYALEDLRMEIETAHPAERANGRMDPEEERQYNFTGKEWRSHLRVQRIEEGPVQTKIVLQGIILDSSVTQEIILYNHEARADFINIIEWRGAMHTQVRIAYPLQVPGGETTYEVPFGTVQVGKDELPGGYSGTPRFVQKWIDISNDDYGVTFATRSGGHSLEKEAICPIVLRSGYTEAEMDFRYENKGTFEFAFSICPHSGSWQEGRTYRQGWEFNNPLLASSLTTKSSMFPIAGRATLPEELSLCQVTAENVVVTSLGKQEAESGETMLRLFETVGQEQEVSCRFYFPLRKAWKTNLLGDHLQELAVQNNEIHFMISPHEICQCALEFEAAG